MRVATSTTVVDVYTIAREAAVTTVDENAFIDALRCMYFLMKREIAYTTNFAELQSLCILLGNETLPTLQKAKNLNYLSKQTLSMGEMVAAIGLALEAEILDEVIVKVKALKLIEIKQGTADAITESIFEYLSASFLCPDKLAGGAIVMGHQL